MKLLLLLPGDSLLSSLCSLRVDALIVFDLEGVDAKVYNHIILVVLHLDLGHQTSHLEGHRI